MNTFFPEAPKLDLPVNYNDCSPAVRRLVREEYIRQQKGLCQHCNKLLAGLPNQEVRDAVIKVELFPPFFFVHPIHLHHNHVTGMTIGAVHARCNAWLWQFRGE